MNNNTKQKLKVHNMIKKRIDIKAKVESSVLLRNCLPDSDRNRSSSVSSSSLKQKIRRVDDVDGSRVLTNDEECTDV